jgi:hypothetical protein
MQHILKTRTPDVYLAAVFSGAFVFGNHVLLLMVLPIALFAVYVGRVLKRQAETQAAAESTQIARASDALVTEHFRQSTPCFYSRLLSAQHFGTLG